MAHSAAGMRILPALSLPVARVAVPEAMAAAAPPEEAPQVMAGFQGLRVVPCRRDVQVQGQTNSGQVVSAWQMAPACSSRSTAGWVVAAMLFLKISEPKLCGLPATAVSSLTVSVSPSRGRALPWR